MPTDPLPDWVPTRRRAIGLAIRSARLHRGLTQEALAELAGGLDRKTISRIENGHMSPILDHLLLIASALGVPLSALVRDS
ncbi:helix-turn-helix domain-containing protein [Streptomyces sp. NRRL S-1813]|uniref:helix-turn-helix domain-containing protein n=1 Tax=Streptomyces sp. NRRL S-1813 TaxID=1463888 RepID=UPI0004C5C392|nr:helix-turn-helix transcriptional regulator [Streptomyces sp. NRRL S-1813]